MAKAHAHHLGQRILLIDHRAFRLEGHQRALRDVGHEVIPVAEYPATDLGVPRGLDLVVLVCTIPGPAELSLVRRFREAGHPSLVLAVVLQPDVMRRLFLEGALDVALLPSAPEGLVELVDSALESTAPAPGVGRLLLAGAR